MRARAEYAIPRTVAEVPGPANLMQRLKQLGKDSLVYGFGGIAARGIGILVLPIYTRIFTPADYGTIEMLGLIATLLTAIIVMGMDTAQSFYFYKQKEAGKNSQAEVVSSILQWRLTWGLAIVIVATLSAPLLNATFFEGELTWHYFALSFSGALFTSVMDQSVQIFRLLYRPWPFIAITLTQILLAVAIVLTLVLAFDRGIIAFFIGSASASLVVACFSWYLVRDYLDFRHWQTDWWPKLIRFGAPLVPAGLAMYGMNTSGRWFLQYYHGADALGKYAVGARFALLFAIVVETFRKAWWPIAMDSMQSEDGPQTFRMIARLYMGVGVSAVIALTVLSPWLVGWLTGPRFHDAWPVVGVLCWQSLFYGLYLVASAGMFKAEKTYVNAYLMGAAAILNIGLNVVLVPQFAGMGAALATVLAFLAWISVSAYFSERYWHTGFRFGVFTAQIILGAAVAAWLIVSQETHSATMRLLVAGVCATLLVFFSIDREHRSQIWAFLQRHG